MGSTAIRNTTLTPKQQEIRERGSRILDCAFPMIREGGLSAVSMNAIAKAMNCTRGTIYNHFPHKEDILLALATRSVRRRTALFQFGISLGTRPREQCSAIGIAAEVYADHMPDEFAIEQITRHDPLWQKTSPERRDVLEQSEHNCLMQVGNVIEAGIQSGDLTVPDLKPRSTAAARATSTRTMVERIVFGLWSIVYGGLVLEATGRLVGPSTGHAKSNGQSKSRGQQSIRINRPRIAMRRNCNALLDSVLWQPMYAAKAYDTFVRRIQPKIIAHVDVIRQSKHDTDTSTETEP